MANKPVDVFKHMDMKNGDPSVCWEWQGGRAGRDRRPYFSAGGVRKYAYIWSWELFNGKEKPDGLVIRHKCDNENCCNPHHLELGTHSDNMRDMRERQRHGLPHNTVKAIRNACANGQTQADVANMFGISQSQVQRIVSGENYGHVED